MFASMMAMSAYHSIKLEYAVHFLATLHCSCAPYSPDCSCASMPARRNLVPCSFNKSLDPAHVLMVERGEYKDGTKSDIILWLLDRDPWLVTNGGPCLSNARVMLRTTIVTGRHRRRSYLEILPSTHVDANGRKELQMKFKTYGRVYLHRIVWWLLRGIKHKDFEGQWAKFQADSRHVDHGAKGHPHILDWRRLRLQSAVASARQGPPIAAQYRSRGGLVGIMRKRPNS